MPGGDQTGPIGHGPGTGRGLGQCGLGMRRAFRCGFGRAFGRTQPLTLTKEQKKKILQEELKTLDEDKQEIEKQIKELK